MFVGSLSKGKQSDRGSSGSIYEVQPGIPCISGSRLKGAPPSHTADSQAKTKAAAKGDGVDEVDSPAKEAAGGLDLTATKLPLQDIDALLCRTEEAGEFGFTGN